MQMAAAAVATPAEYGEPRLGKPIYAAAALAAAAAAAASATAGQKRKAPDAAPGEPSAKRPPPPPGRELYAKLAPHEAKLDAMAQVAMNMMAKRRVPIPAERPAPTTQTEKALAAKFVIDKLYPLADKLAWYASREEDRTRSERERRDLEKALDDAQSDKMHMARDIVTMNKHIKSLEAQLQTSLERIEELTRQQQSPPTPPAAAAAAAAQETTTTPPSRKERVRVDSPQNRGYWVWSARPMNRDSVAKAIKALNPDAWYAYNSIRPLARLVQRLVCVLEKSKETNQRQDHLAQALLLLGWAVFPNTPVLLGGQEYVVRAAKQRFVCLKTKDGRDAEYSWPPYRLSLRGRDVRTLLERLIAEESGPEVDDEGDDKSSSQKPDQPQFKSDAESVDEARRFFGFAQDKALTEDQILKAFRQRSVTAHPDRGGSHEAFLHLQDMRDTLLRTL